MLRQNCPSQETLMGFLSMPAEMRRWERLKVRAHLVRCNPCQEKKARIQATFDSYFQPEPEVASSLLRVYSRLQRDETLILKGWKLNDFRSQRPSAVKVMARSWGFPAGIAVALGLSVVFFSPAFRQNVQEAPVEYASAGMPRMPIRVREKNSVKVRYVQPELLHSVEFETGSP